MNQTHLKKNLAEGDGEGGATVLVQLGANWIHGLTVDNPLYCVAQKLNLELYQTSSDDEPGDDVLLFDGGSPMGNGVGRLSIISQDQYRRACGRYQWIRDRIDDIDEEVYSGETDVSLTGLFEAAVTFSERHSPFGPCGEVEHRCLNWFYNRVSIDLAAPLQDVAKVSYLEGESDGVHGEAIVKSGYYSIIDYLSRELPLDIRLNCEVVHIHQNTEGREVVITCKNKEVFMCDRCIITLPLGVLAHRLKEQDTDPFFSPAVPPCVETICRTVSPGLMNLVWLLYPTAFWPRGYNFFGIAPPSLDRILFSTFLVPPKVDSEGKEAAVLMCQVFGAFAVEIESMTESAIASIATDTLRTMFGEETVPDAIGCTRSKWWSDEYSRGSWSYWDNKSVFAGRGEGEGGGGGKIDFDSLDDPNHLIFIAGEATCEPHRGTAHG
jgi:polyamine oxidase